MFFLTHLFRDGMDFQESQLYVKFQFQLYTLSKPCFLPSLATKALGFWYQQLIPNHKKKNLYVWVIDVITRLVVIISKYVHILSKYILYLKQICQTYLNVKKKPKNNKQLIPEQIYILVNSHDNNAANKHF